jgi:hypothetical protein
MERDSVVLETSMGDVQLELYWVGYFDAHVFNH